MLLDYRVDDRPATGFFDMIDRGQKHPATRAPVAPHFLSKNRLASAKNAVVFKAKTDQKSQYRRCKWHKAAHSQSAWQRARAAAPYRPRQPRICARSIGQKLPSIAKVFCEVFIKVFCKLWKFFPDFRAPRGHILSSF